MAPTRAQLVETATAVIQSFETWTVDNVLAKRSAKCETQILPESLGRPLLDAEGFRQHVLDIQPLIGGGFKVTFVKDPIVDEAARKVVLFVKCSTETAVGPYNNEYIFVIHLNEDGTLADRVEEHLDSVLLRELEGRLSAAKK